MPDTQAATGLHQESLPVEVQLEIDAACEQFEQAWRAGQQPQIDEFVARARESIRAALRDELVIAQRGLQKCRPVSPRPAAGFGETRLHSVDPEAAEQTIKWTPGPTEPAAVASPPGYELLEELGRGGMGVVYKARQTGLNRLVALKMIRSGELASREELERFRAEAQAAARLQHANIVPVYEIGEHRGVPYFSMAFVPGVSLKDRVLEGPLKLREAAALIKSAAEAVAYAHERGVVHRDIKPANILLNEAGEPCITDFGLAKRIDQGSDFTGTGQILGTPSYMPPEQALGRVAEIGPLVDVYALGATLYHLLTGRPPFQAASPIETIKQVVDTEPVPPRRLNAAVDRDLDTICMKCLEKGLAARYASARELADELARYLNHEPIRARRIGPATRAWRWCRRKPLAAAFAGVSVVAGFVGVLLIVRLLATQAVADAHQFFSHVGTARNKIEAGSPGWRHDALAGLAVAGSLRPASADPAEMRSLATQAWSAWDLRPASSEGDLGKPSQVAAIAFSRDGKQVALAEWVRGLVISIHVYDPQTRQHVREYFANVAAESVIRAIRGAKGPQEGFQAVAFSPDGRWLTAGSRHGKLYVWDTTRKEADAVFQWEGHAEAVLQLAFGSDSNVLYSSSSAEGPIRRWNLQAFPPTMDELPGNHRHFAVSSDGKWLASAPDEMLMLYDAVSLQPKRKWPTLSGVTVAIAANSRLLAASVKGGETLQIIELPSGRVVREIRDAAAPGVKIDRHLSFADQDRLLLSSCSDERVRVWEVDSGAPLGNALASGREFPPAAIDPRGRYFALAGEFKRALYEIHPPEMQHLSALSEHPIKALDFADASTLALATEELQNGLVSSAGLRLWDLANGGSVHESRVLTRGGIDKFEPIRCWARFQPQGMEAMWGLSIASLRWRKVPPTAAGVTHSLEPGALGGAALEEDTFEPSGNTTLCRIEVDPLASNLKAMRVAPAGDVLIRLSRANLDSLKPGFAGFLVVRVEGDCGAEVAFEHRCFLGERKSSTRTVAGSDLVAGSYHLVQINQEPWPQDQATTVEALIRVKDPPGLTAVWIDRVLVLPVSISYNKSTNTFNELVEQGPFCYSPDGQQLWGILDETELICRRLPDFAAPFEVPKLLYRLAHGDEVLRDVAVGSQVAVVGARRGDLFVLSTADGKLLRNESRSGHAIQVVALHPAGNLAVAGTDQGVLWVVSVPQLETLTESSAHAQGITSLVFSGDGEVLVSGSVDRTVRLWRRESRGFTELFRLEKLPGPVQLVRLSADKRWLAVLLKGDRAVRIWKLDELNDRFAQLRAKVDELPSR